MQIVDKLRTKPFFFDLSFYHGLVVSLIFEVFQQFRGSYIVSRTVEVIVILLIGVDKILSQAKNDFLRGFGIHWRVYRSVGLRSKILLDYFMFELSGDKILVLSTCGFTTIRLLLKLFIQIVFYLIGLMFPQNRFPYFYVRVFFWKNVYQIIWPILRAFNISLLGSFHL